MASSLTPASAAEAAADSTRSALESVSSEASAPAVSPGPTPAEPRAATAKAANEGTPAVGATTAPVPVVRATTAPVPEPTPVTPPIGTGAVSIKGPSSELLPGVTVEIRTKTCQGPAVWRTTTTDRPDAYGAFGIGLEAGDYCIRTLSVPSPYWLPNDVMFTMEQRPANWVTVWVPGPEPKPVVTGAVVAKNDGGTPINGVTVRIREGGCEDEGPAVWQNTTAANRWADGGFGISLTEGLHCVTTLSVPKGYDPPLPFEVNATSPSPFWVTVWVPGPGPYVPPPAVAPSAQADARALVNSGRVSYGLSLLRSQIESYANGVEYVNPATGRSCNINDVLLHALRRVVVEQGFSIRISSLNRWCEDTGNASSWHYRNGGGHAVDISQVNGVFATGGTANDRALINAMTSVLPPPAGLGQLGCPGHDVRVPTGWVQFADSCNHNHFEYRGADIPVSG